MGRIVPPLRPKKSELEVRALAAEHGADPANVFILGIRGYYLDTMGAPGRNDRAIYDDALFVCGPGKGGKTLFIPFNANTDPSVARSGVAVLNPGKWEYKVGVHGLSKPAEQRYTALVQAGEVTVRRDGQGNDTGWFGINIHRGSYSTTSSLGCQTIWPDQWGEFIATVRAALRDNNQTELAYILIENTPATNK